MGTWWKRIALSAALGALLLLEAVPTYSAAPPSTPANPAAPAPGQRIVVNAKAAPTTQPHKKKKKKKHHKRRHHRRRHHRRPKAKVVQKVNGAPVPSLY